MSTISIAMPVFMEENGRKKKLVSYDTVRNEFAVVDVDTGIRSNRMRPINAKHLRLNIKQEWQSPMGDVRALSYLLDLGVSNIINTRDHSNVKIRSVNRLLDALDDLQLRDINPQYSALHDVYIINDHDLSDLCSVTIMPRSKPLKYIIEILASHGYRVRKLDRLYGWLYGVVETPKGVVIFG